MKYIVRLLSMLLITTLLTGNLAYAADTKMFPTGIMGISEEPPDAEKPNEEPPDEEQTDTDAEQSDTEQISTASSEGTNSQESVTVSSPSAILMEASTGKVIFEKSPDEKRSPASITKIMTLLLAFEALEKGKIKLTDEVITSAHAKSMGGSQVFLEEGEVQTVDTLLKCITVASGNDASVALAEYIAGSEEEFVNQMNSKAESLGMEHTHFEDCCGLTASENHYSTARDIAVMSRELITKHPDIYHYTKIWMEDITHTTKRGSTPFTLSSTNKLLKQYQWATGLKTGSTSAAKYCLSATANKDAIDLIAVVMAAPDYKIRFQDAIKLLNFGFSVSKLYEDKNQDALSPIQIAGAVVENVPIAYEGTFQYLDVEGNDLSKIEKEIEVIETAEAPVEKGTVAGEAVYRLNGKKIGSVPLLYAASVEKAYYKDYIWKVFCAYLL